jgi:hypothetical protein
MATRELAIVGAACAYYIVGGTTAFQVSGDIDRYYARKFASPVASTAAHAMTCIAAGVAWPVTMIASEVMSRRRHK